MIAGAGEAARARGLPGGAGAVAIALIYGVLGPLVGVALLTPLAAFVTADFMGTSVREGLGTVLSTLRISLPAAYLMGGALALATGAVIGATARRKRASLRTALWAPIAVYLVVALVCGATGLALPGAGAARSLSSPAMPLWIIVSVLASLACWLATLPIQRRMR